MAADPYRPRHHWGPATPVVGSIAPSYDRDVRMLLPIAALLAGCGLVPHPVDAADPRFGACGGQADTVIAAFPFRADEYRDHFPEMGRSPELEVETDAFAVVFDLDFRPAMMGGQRPRDDAPVEEPPPLTGHFVCVYLGAPGEGDTNLYADVDVAWMRP
jgi:hypothetical protein